MKTKQIKGKVDILLVGGLPEQKVNEFKFGGMWLNMIRWKYISTIEGITEFEADLLMEEMITKYDIHGYKGFGNFDWFSHAVPAFHSLLSANDIHLRNELEYKDDWEPSTGVVEDDPEWKKFQEKVFSPSTTLIFIKE